MNEREKKRIITDLKGIINGLELQRDELASLNLDYRVRTHACLEIKLKNLESNIDSIIEEINDILNEF